MNAAQHRQYDQFEREYRARSFSNSSQVIRSLPVRYVTMLLEHGADLKEAFYIDLWGDTILAAWLFRVISLSYARPLTKQSWLRGHRLRSFSKCFSCQHFVKQQTVCFCQVFEENLNEKTVHTFLDFSYTVIHKLASQVAERVSGFWYIHIRERFLVRIAESPLIV